MLRLRHTTRQKRHCSIYFQSNKKKFSHFQSNFNFFQPYFQSNCNPFQSYFQSNFNPFQSNEVHRHGHAARKSAFVAASKFAGLQLEITVSTILIFFINLLFYFQKSILWLCEMYDKFPNNYLYLKRSSGCVSFTFNSML